MSKFNDNRRWAFERNLYDETCTLLRPEVAERINRPCIVQLSLFGSVGVVETEISRVDDGERDDHAARPGLC